MELKDQDFIHLLKNGDAATYEKVYTSFFKRLHTYAFLTVKDALLAEEIVQEIFYRIWERKEKLSIHTSLNAYLYASVHYECLLQLKRQKRQTDYQSTLLYLKKNIVHQEDAAMKVLQSQLEEKFLEALNNLPERCRTIFQLNRIEKQKYWEIASQLGLSVKTVENQMGKAIKLLRVSLAEFLPILIFVVWHL